MDDLLIIRLKPSITVVLLTGKNWNCKNIIKHGVSFEEVILVITLILHILQRDYFHNTVERDILIPLVCIFSNNFCMVVERFRVNIFTNLQNQILQL